MWTYRSVMAVRRSRGNANKEDKVEPASKKRARPLIARVRELEKKVEELQARDANLTPRVTDAAGSKVFCLRKP